MDELGPGLRRGDDFVVICRLDDIVPNTGVCALVAGRQIAVFRLDDDSVYAVDNLDPFSRANVLLTEGGHEPVDWRLP